MVKFEEITWRTRAGQESLRNNIEFQSINQLSTASLKGEAYRET